MTAAAIPALAADLDAGLRRLKLASMRRLAPELLVTAKTQRWNPEEFLRTLIDAELTSRDASNARTRMKAAAFPVIKTIDEFDVTASSIPQRDLRLPRLAGMDPGHRELLRRRPGRDRQVPQPRRVRGRRRPGRSQGPVLHRRRPRRDPLPGPGRQLRRPRHREPAAKPTSSSSMKSGSRRSTTPAPSCCSGSSPPPTNGARSPSAPTGPSTSGAGSCPSTPPPSACWTGSCTTASSWSPKASRSGCAKPGTGQEDTTPATENQPRDGDFYLATSGDTHLAVDSRARLLEQQPPREGLCPASVPSATSTGERAGWGA